VIRIVTKIELIGPWAMPYTSKKFRQNPFTTFSVIRQTGRQTDRSENITSFGGGNKFQLYSVLGRWNQTKQMSSVGERCGGYEKSFGLSGKDGEARKNREQPSDKQFAWKMTLDDFYMRVFSAFDTVSCGRKTFDMQHSNLQSFLW